MRVLADVALADPLDEVVALLLDPDAPQVVRVEPALQPVDVPVGGGLSVLDGEIVVEAVRCGLGLRDDNSAESDEDDEDHRGKRQVYDCNRQPAPDPQPAE